MQPSFSGTRCAVVTLVSNGGDINPDRLRFLSPLGWEDINFTGDYTWPRTNHINRQIQGHCNARQNLSVGYFTYSQDHPPN